MTGAVAEKAERIIGTHFNSFPSTGSTKIMSLREAMARFIKPGMTLHFTTTHNRPNGVIYEIIRQFNRKKPGFTVVALGAGSTLALLIHRRLVRKLICGFLGDAYPSPGPNPIIQSAVKTHKLVLENWSLLTLSQRIMAGAKGLPFLPTNSLSGSNMAEENKKNGNYQEIANPFDNGNIGLIRALVPDISFVHAVASDKNGNALLTPPLGEGIYGALSAKEGAIVTTEKVLNEDDMREYSHFVKIPSYVVRAVCPLNFGAHPAGLSARGVSEVESYADDYEFMIDLREASRAPASLDKWMDEWVFNCGNHEGYLKKLGASRIIYLKGRAEPDSWMHELPELVDEKKLARPPKKAELIVTTAARLLKERIKSEGYRTILAGIGVSNLAAWLANYSLYEDGYAIDLMAEIGFYGYQPRPMDPFIFNFRNIPTCRMLTEIESVLGMFVSGLTNKCIGIIGAGQIDISGNINTTLLSGNNYLVGSGGANDICSSAKEVLVTMFADKKRLVKKLHYITSPGHRVRTLVTDVGVFEKESDDKFVFSGYYDLRGISSEMAIRNAKARCGWKFMISRDPRRISLPVKEELTMLRLFDPMGYFLEGS